MPPPGQLNIPLVWEQGRGTPDTTGKGDSPPSPHELPAFAASWRLWLSALADAGAVVLAVAGIWGIAAARGAELTPAQLVLAGLAGLEAGSVVALGCFWGWRASPGMLLAGVCFSRPIPWGRVYRLWFCWLLSLGLAGLPLLFRLRGESVAERLAGGTLRFRSLPEGA